MSHLSWVTVALICLLLPFAQLEAASGWSPLLRATFSGDLNTIRSLLDEGKNINQRDEEGSTPLMVAASRGHIAIARELLSRGAGVNLRNDYGWTPLMMATAGRNAEIVKLLLARGADPEIQNRDGKNTLAVARTVGLEHLFPTVSKASSQQRKYSFTQRQQKRPVQPQQQVLKQPQQPETELAQQKLSQMEKLLAKAQQQVKALRLSLPAGDNAFESYQQVLELEPGNAEAKAGLAHIAERYAQLARLQQAAGELETSLEYIARGLQVRPQDETLLALRQRVREDQIEIERQRAEAERRRMRVAGLLRQGDEQLAAKQLTLSVLDNAFESYRQVLELDPSNTKAEAGLTRVAKRYAQLARRRQVAVLLKQAEEQLAVEQLTEPAAGNAWESYRRVLELAPDNAQAEAGLAEIAARYAQRARKHQEARAFESSLAAIDKGLQVRQQDKTLLALQAEVQQAQAEVDRQRAEAEQRRRLVAALLRQADKQSAAAQLTEPAGDNACESYQQVLALEPDNTAAQAGLQRLLKQAKQILNDKIKTLNHIEQEVELEGQAIRLSIQRTLAQEWEQYSKQTASQ
jgi:tetratricopeptide (TPR) repeat protein